MPPAGMLARLANGKQILATKLPAGALVKLIDPPIAHLFLMRWRGQAPTWLLLIEPETHCPNYGKKRSSVCEFKDAAATIARLTST
jgi:hypothetical protein